MENRTCVQQSNRRYRRMVLKNKNSNRNECKVDVNSRLASLFGGRRRALVLDDCDLRTSTALLTQGKRKRGTQVTVANPCASSFVNSASGLKLVDSTVEEVILSRCDEKYDLIYLDFCSKFVGCFDTVESSVNCLARTGVLAYTVCNRGVSREHIAYNALRHRELARTHNLHLVACVAYRDMVTIIMTRDADVIDADVIDADVTGVKTNVNHFQVVRFSGWRVCENVLQFRIVWEFGEITWEPATTLVEDLDRSTFMRLVHNM